MLGLRDSVTEFAQHDHRDRRPRLPPQNLTDTRFAVHERGQRVGIQDHARSSGSMTSNRSSILAWMRCVSLRSRRSLPNPSIHPGSPRRVLSVLTASFSCNASVTSCLSVWPRSAALDLALRNRRSGISSVVFMSPYYHIYGCLYRSWYLLMS